MGNCNAGTESGGCKLCHKCGQPKRTVYRLKPLESTPPIPFPPAQKLQAPARAMFYYQPKVPRGVQLPAKASTLGDAAEFESRGKESCASFAAASHVSQRQVASGWCLFMPRNLHSWLRLGFWRLSRCMQSRAFVGDSKSFSSSSALSAPDWHPH